MKYEDTDLKRSSSGRKETKDSRDTKILSRRVKVGQKLKKWVGLGMGGT